MTNKQVWLNSIQAIVQEDVGTRGLRSDPTENLLNACAHDFHEAAQSLAATPNGTVGILTGFFIPYATPPAGETDGPLGAVFLARALIPLGYQIVIYAEEFCAKALTAGLKAAGVRSNARISTLSPKLTAREARERIEVDGLTHLIALERVGPSHTDASILAQAGDDRSLVETFHAEVPEHDRDRLHSMRGVDITNLMAPGHLLVEAANAPNSAVKTIGIGDGGNEIGMGKIPWRIIRKNIARGGLIACRVPTRHLLVAGISNWGAYGLGVAVNLLHGESDLQNLLDEWTEEAILRRMVEKGPLVDGVSGKQSVSVDGLTFDRYIAPFHSFRKLQSAQQT
jgi:hypothetical protein